MATGINRNHEDVMSSRLDRGQNHVFRRQSEHPRSNEITVQSSKSTIRIEYHKSHNFNRDTGHIDSDRRNRRRDREESELAQRQLDALREQYLGSNRPTKRIMKPSDKFRVITDWDASDDTTDSNQITSQGTILFGTGCLAGIDRIEQKKMSARNRKRSDMKVELHWSEKKLGEMKERDWRIFKEDFNISYKGRKIPEPMRNWRESNLSPKLLKAVEKAGYRTPSPIQMAAIPLGLQQRDVIGVAETGSGKTAAFVLPMLNYIDKLPRIRDENAADGPYAVVLAPARELALQIEEETKKFASYLNINVVSIIGGQSIHDQSTKMMQGCEIVIATPGRLNDCLNSHFAVLNRCNYVVLDEADRMIDMGFGPQVADILNAMPSSNLKPENEEEKLDEKKIYRTTYMFSATMPSAVERLAKNYLRNPVVVDVGTAGKSTDLITQHVVMVKENDKMNRLKKLLYEIRDEMVIVFVNTRNASDDVVRILDREGLRVTSLHGGKSQEQREISLEEFRKKRCNVLVATNVAGRGIDIADVAHVINYDMPDDIEAYTHRIGRTGRAGKKGIATTFLTMNDTNVFYDLKQMLIQSNSHVPTELSKHEASKFKSVSIPNRRNVYLS